MGIVVVSSLHTFWPCLSVFLSVGLSVCSAWKQRRNCGWTHARTRVSYLPLTSSRKLYSKSSCICTKYVIQYWSNCHIPKTYILITIYEVYDEILVKLLYSKNVYHDYHIWSIWWNIGHTVIFQKRISWLPCRKYMMKYWSNCYIPKTYIMITTYEVYDEILVKLSHALKTTWFVCHDYRIPDIPGRGYCSNCAWTMPDSSPYTYVRIYIYTYHLIHIHTLQEPCEFEEEAQRAPYIHTYACTYIHTYIHTKAPPRV
jgi:hypothetical protein